MLTHAPAPVLHRASPEPPVVLSGSPEGCSIYAGMTHNRIREFPVAEHHRIERPPRTAIIRGADRVAIEGALMGTAETTAFDAAGRGVVALFALAEGEGVLRRCRRGGLIGKLVNEGYVLRNRPLAEFSVHEYLFEAGVSVPEPLGVMWEQRGLVIRGVIATRRLDAIGLSAWLAESNKDNAAILAAIGRAIRSMHDAGVYHADLHVENILVNDEHVYLIDFDNAHRHDPLSAVRRARNLLRLRRSLQKHGIYDIAYDAILAGYGAIAFPTWLDAAYRLKAKASDLMAAS